MERGMRLVSYADYVFVSANLTIGVVSFVGALVNPVVLILCGILFGPNIEIPPSSIIIMVVNILIICVDIGVVCAYIYSYTQKEDSELALAIEKSRCCIVEDAIDYSDKVMDKKDYRCMWSITWILIVFNLYMVWNCIHVTRIALKSLE